MSRKLAVAIALALGLGFVGTAAGASRYWSESNAERVVLKKVRIPCKTVFPNPNDPDWPGPPPACAKLKVLSDVEIKRRVEDACKDVFPDQRYSCTYQAIVQYEGANEIARVTQTGFALSRADCIGAGEPDKSDVRFTRFRCKVFVVWHPPSFGGRPRTIRAHGRIAVWPTGRASLSWKLI